MKMSRTTDGGWGELGGGGGGDASTSAIPHGRVHAMRSTGVKNVVDIHQNEGIGPLETLGITQVDSGIEVDTHIRRVTIALELLLGHGMGRPHEPITIESALKHLQTYGELGELEGLPNERGERSKFTLLHTQESDQYKAFKDGVPLVRDVNDDYGNLVENVRQIEVSREEAGVLFSQYVDSMESALRGVDKTLKPDPQTGRYYANPANIAMLSKVTDWYQALVHVFSQYPEITMMTHLTRSPARGTVGLLQMVYEISEEDDLPILDDGSRQIPEKYEERILASVHKLLGGLEVVKKLSKGDRKIGPVNLEAPLIDAIRTSSVGDISVINENPQDLDVDVIGSNQYLVFVFQNLIENASRFGEVKIEVVSNNDFVEIRVHDKAGFIDRDRERAFYDAPRKTSTGGGIGMFESNKMTVDLNRMRDFSPEFAHFLFGLEQQRPTEENGNQTVKYFYLRVPRIAKAQEPAQRVEAISDGPQALAA